MRVPAPHFHLFSEAADPAEPARWRFVLRSDSGETLLEAADEEQQAGPERLELLAIVRGLEALDQPSRVTLVTASRNIQHGLRTGLAHWRENDWQWERYGKLAPVKNADLWQRIARVQSIHTLECRCPQPRGIDDLAPPHASAAMATRTRRFTRVDAGAKRLAAPARRMQQSGAAIRIDAAHVSRAADAGNRRTPVAQNLGGRLLDVVARGVRRWTSDRLGLGSR